MKKETIKLNSNFNPQSKTLSSVYCEVDVLNECRSAYGSIRNALIYAANKSISKSISKQKKQNESI
jgi:hypothetical protein